MEKYFKAICAVIILTITACNESDVRPKYELGANEQRLIGDWEYSEIRIGGNTFQFANEFTEPGFSKSNRGGERAIISRRWINYNAESNYQLRWNRSTYQLGTSGDPNWQPNFGNWSMNEAGDSLYHNKGFDYEVAYKIFLSGDFLTRTSDRYMSESPHNLWAVGDTVTFVEVFRRR